MDLLDLRDRVVDQYPNYVRSFLSIRDRDKRAFVERYVNKGQLRRELLVQLNPAFKPIAAISRWPPMAYCTASAAPSSGAATPSASPRAAHSPRRAG